MNDLEILKLALSIIPRTMGTILVGILLLWAGILSLSIQTGILIFLFAFLIGGKPTFQWWVLREYESYNHLSLKEKKRTMSFDYDSFDAPMMIVSGIIFLFLGILAIPLTRNLLTVLSIVTVLFLGIILSIHFWRFIHCIYRQKRLLNK